MGKGKGKVFPLQAGAGPWGSGRLRLPDFLDFRHYKDGKVVTLTHRPSLTPGVSWYSFLEAESTPGHMVPSVASEKNHQRPLGMDPETLRLAAQCLNHYATPGLLYNGYRVSFPEVKRPGRDVNHPLRIWRRG
jgi:hypothetical protein